MFSADGPPGLLHRIRVRPTPNVEYGVKNRLAGAAIHYTAGSEAGSIDWLTKRGSGVSAHYVIGRDGTITQLARLKDVSWHAGRAWYSDNPNRWLVGYEMVATAADGYTFTDEQYQVLTEHLAWLFQTNGLAFQYPDGDPASPRDDRGYWRRQFTVGGLCIGHSAVNPRKPDPGANFDWGRLRRQVLHLQASVKKGGAVNSGLKSRTRERKNS